MTTDVRMERLYDRVELVSGMGSPRRGKLCIMSFAAYLSGDRHTDEPRCVSPVIRLFAIPLNDGMDSATRQRLKPFAPRVVGTNDRRDAERAELMIATLFDTILPQAIKDWPPRPVDTASGQAPVKTEDLLRLIRTGTSQDVRAAFDGLRDSGVLEEARRAVKSYRAGGYCSMAETISALLVGLAQAAPNAERSAWYWNAGINLLDQLCEVGAEKRRVALRKDRIDAMLRPRPAGAKRPASAGRSKTEVVGA